MGRYTAFLLMMALLLIIAGIAGAQTQEDEKINWEKVPPEKISTFDASRIEINELNNDQLAHLSKKQIEHHISDIGSEQLKEMNPNAVKQVSSTKARDYFSKRLSSGCNPENENERLLLKQIRSFKNVNIKSFEDPDNTGFGRDDDGDYVKGPNGKVYLEQPAEVKHTQQGISVDGKVRLTDGELTVSDNYRLGLESSADLLHDGAYSGVSVNSELSMPTLSSEEPEYTAENHVIFGGDTLNAKGGGYEIVAHDDNDYSTFTAQTPDNSLTVRAPDNSADSVLINPKTVSYLKEHPEEGTDIVGESRREAIGLLPFEKQALSTSDTTIVSEDGGQSFTEKEGSYLTRMYEGVKGWFGGGDEDSEEEGNEEGEDESDETADSTEEDGGDATGIVAEVRDGGGALYYRSMDKEEMRTLLKAEDFHTLSDKQKRMAKQEAAKKFLEVDSPGEVERKIINADE